MRKSKIIMGVQFIFMQYLLSSSPGDSTISVQFFQRKADPVLANTKVTAYGMAAVDYDCDGFLDIHCVDLGATDRLFHNEGDGIFRLITEAEGAPDGKTKDCGVSWGDFDNDGDPDLVIGTQTENNHIFWNDGPNGFTRMMKGIAATDKLSSYDAVWVDYDNDGWLDLYTSNLRSIGPGTGMPNYLFHNNGNGTFSKIIDGVISADAGNTITGSWADYDNDGDEDLFAPDAGRNNYFYINNGDGSFTSVTDGELIESGSYSLSGAWADYDNDGYLDLFVADGNIAQKDMLFHNDGNGSFTRIFEGLIVNTVAASWNGAWGDIDNDGDEDLYVSVYTGQNYLYLNAGDGTFLQVIDDPIVAESKGSGTSVSLWADFDNDGDLDFVTCECNSGRNLLYENLGNSNHWISIDLIGTISNRSAIGSQVRIKANMGGKDIWQMREISASNGFRSISNGFRAHFGLGNAMMIDSLLIRWPSGQQTVQINVAVDQFLTVEEEHPLGYLRSGFLAENRKGSGFDTLQVQFKDQSLSDPAFQIQSWEWDFNNDGNIDSYEQNPLYTFTSQTAATFDVRLVTKNGQQTAELVREGFVSLQGHVSIIDCGPSTMGIGTISTSIDTSLMIYNRGVAEDTLSLVLDKYGESISYEPSQFVITGFDSQKISLHINIDGLESKTYLFRLNFFNNQNDQIKSKMFTVKVDKATEINQNHYQAESFSLEQNYPNPFNPMTRISYSLIHEADVSLKVYDIHGKLVANPVHEFQTAGCHSLDFFSGNLSSGVYFYKLQAGDKVMVKKMTLMR